MLTIEEVRKLFKKGDAPKIAEIAGKSVCSVTEMIRVRPDGSPGRPVKDWMLKAATKLYETLGRKIEEE